MTGKLKVTPFLLRLPPMKCFLPLSLLALLLSVLSLNAAPAAAPGLGRTWAKLDKDKQLIIGYFGGSITAGAGASRAEATSWRALTTAWFRQQFPQAHIQEINAAVGGTGSDFGAYRCQRDLLSRHPDLVFVEFAVNDFGFPDARASAYYEGVIRQILQSNPAVDIVVTYAVTKEADNYPQGGTPHTLVSEQKIADYYGLASVNPGKALSQAIQDGHGTWATLTIDNTHPNDVGYRIYADEMIRFLQSHLQDQPAVAPPLPGPLNPHPVDRVSMVDAWTAKAPAWKQEPPAGNFPRSIACNTPGATLDLPFEGTAIGLDWMITPDGGMIDYSIDGAPARSASSWDTYALKFSRPNTFFVAENLPPGKHVLHLKISDQKAPQSTGQWIRIEAFLIQDGNSAASARPGNTTLSP